MRSQRGFTLIELMVVIAIVAILAAIAVSAYSTSIAKTQFSEALSITDGLKPDIITYYHQTSSCPSAGEGGIIQPASYGGKYVASVTVASAGEGCTLTALFRSSTVAPALRGKQVVLRLENPADIGNALWICSSNVPGKYVPETCR
jgi:type IV pilus assembly protein PilA